MLRMPTHRGGRRSTVFNQLGRVYWGGRSCQLEKPIVQSASAIGHVHRPFFSSFFELLALGSLPGLLS